MASPTKTITALVLRRTKLGETDVIVTLLAEDGSQVKAVAKGARKPTSSFASRLELYSVAKILVAEGKNLDIVKEVRLLEGNEALRNDFFRSSAISADRRAPCEVNVREPADRALVRSFACSASFHCNHS